MKLEDIEKRMEEITKEIHLEDADLDALNTEVDGLKEKRTAILEDAEKRQKLMSDVALMSNATVLEKHKTEERGAVNPFRLKISDLAKGQDEIDAELEQRGKDLLEKRAVTVATGDLVLPKHDKGTINDTFNQISTLIDRVQVTPLDGGESYSVPYEIAHGEGNYTEEGEPYFDVSVEFGYADILKTKVTAYSEITEEVEKLPRADYASRIFGGVEKALRKKITKEILTGAGGTGEFVGIFSDKATAINPATDIEIADVDDETLDKIIYAYGGDEDVEDEAVLILNKDDLRKFAMLKHEDGRKVYEVVNNGNTGTINGVRYVINSAAGSTTTALAGEYLMAYGPLSNYEMGVFSPVEVKRSEDVKFKEGMIAHRASVFAGGNVVSFNGFVRVKKVAGV